MLFSVIFSIAKTDLETFLHNTHMRPNLMLAGWPMMIALVSWSLPCRTNGPEMTSLSNAGVGV